MPGWLTSIILSLVSGVILYLITSFITFKGESKVQKQRRLSANYEITNTIKSLILEKDGINIKYIDSITNFISKKYEIKKEDLVSFSDIIDEVITEISQSCFLSSPQKKENIKNLIEKKDSYSKELKSLQITKKEDTKDKNKERIRIISLVYSITMCLMLLSTLPFIIEKSNVKSDLLVLFSPIISMTFLVFAVIIYTLGFYIKSKNDLKEIQNKNFAIRSEISEINNNFFKKG